MPETSARLKRRPLQPNCKNFALYRHQCHDVAFSYQTETLMIPRIEIATVLIPGGGSLRLMRRGAEFSIMLDGNELMNSRLSGSEEALATLTIDRLGAIAKPHLLIGGLGMGFTLRTALGRLGPAARVTVAELVPAVVEWARGPLCETFGGCLQDARVDIVEADVGDVIGSARATYDAILLDVDNGPDGLTRDSNNRLYDPAGLSAARTAIKPGGVLAVWSATPSDRFSRRLRNAGFEVEIHQVRASRGKGARHTLWISSRRNAKP
jgi:spermidine synthase